MSLVILERAGLQVTVDPRHGGEIQRIRSAPNHEILYWSSGLGARLTESDYESSQRDWLANYHGGWQHIAPNPGAARKWRGRRFGFHGGVGSDAWTIEASSEASVLLRCESAGGLVATREVSIESAVGTPYRRVTVRGQHNKNAVPWLQHAVFACGPNSRVRLGDAQLDAQVADFLRGCAPGEQKVFVQESTGSAMICASDKPGVHLRWSQGTWPLLWIWAGRDGDRHFMGLEPANCRLDGGLAADHHPISSRGQVQVTVRADEKASR